MELKVILVYFEVKVEVGLDGLVEVFGLGFFCFFGYGVFKEINELCLVYVFMFICNGLKIWWYWNVKSE